MKKRILVLLLTVILLVALLTGCTESTKCGLVDIKSDFTGGLDRVINVYTADGQLLAHYEGKIDIDTNDGGYVKFDHNGQRYIYYNCFVETIADI